MIFSFFLFVFNHVVNSFDYPCLRQTRVILLRYTNVFVFYRILCNKNLMKSNIYIPMKLRSSTSSANLHVLFVTCSIETQ
jgi:hypothetical protein